MQYFKGIGNEVILALVAPTFILLFLVIKFLVEQISQAPHTGAGDSASSRRYWTDWLPAWLYQPDTEHPNENVNRNRTHFNTDTCSICIGPFRLPLETNCGHLFCGTCISALTSHHFALRAVRCPLCRQSVSIFYECFSEEELHTDSEDRSAIREMVQYYNRRFSGQHSSLWCHLRDFPTTVRHLWREILRSDGDTAHTIFRLRIALFFAAAVMYLASPLDLVPEAAFGALGLLDDVMVVVLLAIYLSILYRRLVVSRGLRN
ncbi:E3 ubiquitin-protein ligase RNF170 [Frankliniella fusca]|uniref:E3 ubiquitin-protein ligase RNF170 n=1 Tax=Frankliniella fusca TaxID=407009 RepID=A0AAE1LL81_9NEOP|nr:E3 ubiquitin-protein ligase RNF170 [Frankliniella fusca]